MISWPRKLSRESAVRLALAALAFATACGPADLPPEEGEGAASAGLAEIEKQLESIGYVNVVPAVEPHAEGVVHLDPAGAAPGWNLFNSRQESVARFTSLDGDVVHRIGSQLRGQAYDEFRRLLPSYLPGYLEGWNHIEPTPEGDLLAIATHHALLRLGFDSTLQWKLDISAHHDLALGEDGLVYVLTDSLRVDESVAPQPVVFQDNQVTVVSGDGKVLRRISLFDAFRDRPEREIIERLIAFVPAAQAKRLAQLRAHAERGDAAGDSEPRRLLELYEAAIRGEISDAAGTKNILLHGRDEDVFHSNSIQVLPADVPGLWKRGDLLLSIRSLNRIAVLDPVSERIVWTFGGGVLEAQHDATWLPDGSILLFDNGPRRGFSRLLRIDPVRREVVWEYLADPPESFFSAASSGVQPLPNGNWLVTVTETGRAFELAADGRVVWEYLSEVVRAEPGKAPMRGALYRMRRVPPDAYPQLAR